MDILDFYRSLLAAAGLDVTEEGNVLLRLPEGKAPLTIQGQSLVLPTPAILSQGVGEERIVFHPVCEGIARKESPVLKRYRKVLQYRLNWTMAELIVQLMDIAVDTSRHSKLSPDQAQFLTVVSAADQKTLDALTKVIGKVDNEKVDRRLINTYIKRPGLLKGREYPRVAVVTFPFLDCIKDPEPIIFGVKMRQKDKDAIVALFKYILPKANELDEYSYGTTDLVAPNLYSLMMATAGLSEKLNDKVALYSDQLEDADQFVTDLSFTVGLESMARYRALVPEQLGNTGEKLDGKEDVPEDVSAPATTKPAVTRPVISYPPPDSERPADVVKREPVRPEQYPAPAPQRQDSSVRKNMWRESLAAPVYGQQPAQHYPPPPPGPQYPAQHYAPPPPPPPPGYYDPRVHQPAGHTGMGSAGRNQLAAERMRAQHYAQPGPAMPPPPPGYYYDPHTNQYLPYQGGPPQGSQYYR